MPKKVTSTTCLLVLMVFTFCTFDSNCVQAQFLGDVYINFDGSITGTNNIQREGDIYMFTGNISGGIQIQKSNIILDGAGYAIEGNGEGRGVDLSNGRGQDPSRPEISNVTVRNLKILNFYYGVDNLNTHSNTFIGNYIENGMNSFWVTGSYGNLITNNTLVNASIAINYAGSSNITCNNFFNCWVMVWLSTPPVVDGNYWNDYQTRYPDAKEIAYTDVWNTPYEYSEGNTDNHPQTRPVPFPLFEKPVAEQKNSNSNEPTDSSSTVMIFAFGFTVAIAGICFFLYFDKRNRRQKINE